MEKRSCFLINPSGPFGSRIVKKGEDSKEKIESLKICNRKNVKHANSKGHAYNNWCVGTVNQDIDRRPKEIEIVCPVELPRKVCLLLKDKTFCRSSTGHNISISLKDF